MPYLLAGIAGLFGVGYAADQIGDAARDSRSSLNSLAVVAALGIAGYIIYKKLK